MKDGKLNEKEELELKLKILVKAMKEFIKPNYIHPVGIPGYASALLDRLTQMETLNEHTSRPVSVLWTGIGSRPCGAKANDPSDNTRGACEGSTRGV